MSFRFQDFSRGVRSPPYEYSQVDSANIIDLFGEDKTRGLPFYETEEEKNGSDVDKQDVDLNEKLKQLKEIEGSDSRAFLDVTKPKWELDEFSTDVFGFGYEQDAK